MAARYNKLTIDRGAVFGQAFTYYPEGRDADPQDWTGWTGTAELRSRGRRPTEIDVTLNSTGSNLIAMKVG